MRKLVRIFLVIILTLCFSLVNIKVYAEENSEIVEEVKDITKCKILNIENKNYTGKTIKQDIKIIDNDQELILNTDYKVSYKNNKNIGTATIIIKGIGKYTGSISKKFKIVVASPKDLSSKQSTSSITLKWSKNSGSITGYEVYYSTKKNKNFKKNITTKKNSYKKTKLSAGKTYYFKVRTYKTIKGKKKYSSYIYLTTATKPKTPSIKVSSNTTSADIGWKKISGASGYEVLYSTDNKEYIKVGDTKNLKYKVENIENVKKYYYKVRAYKNIGKNKVYSSYSKAVSSITKPNRTSVTFYKDDTNAIINWDKIENADGYEIYQSSNGKKYSRIKTITNNNTTSYKKTKLSNSKAYYYKVRAYKNIGKSRIYSSYSKVVNNIVITMNFTSTGIKLKGNVVNGSGKYKLKLCSSSTCIPIKATTSDKYYYVANINTKSLANDNYKLYISDNGKNMLIHNNLTFINRINRAKVGSKLVTVSYPHDNPMIKIENFKYEYDILIDAGHGGSDPGSINEYIKEKDLNLEQTLYEKKRYEEHGLKVKAIRTDDTYGLMLGPSSENNLRRRAYAIGYYGVVTRYIYSNHHNSTTNKKRMGYEILVPNQGTVKNNANPYTVAKMWNKVYPLEEKHNRIYGRHYYNDSILNKEKGQVYNVKNYYAVQRIPYELFNLPNVVTYEGCYLSNLKDYNWYKENWKTLSEIKIKVYVESLGKEYIPPKE